MTTSLSFPTKMFSKHHNHYTNRIVVSLHRLTATVTDGISFGGDYHGSDKDCDDDIWLTSFGGCNECRTGCH